MIGGAAGDDDDLAQLPDLLIGETDALQTHLALVVHPLRERIRERDGLFVDLLEHEGLEAGLLGGVLVPIDVFRA